MCADKFEEEAPNSSITESSANEIWIQFQILIHATVWNWGTTNQNSWTNSNKHNYLAIYDEQQVAKLAWTNLN